MTHPFKLLVIGEGGAGKDTFCSLLHKHTKLTFNSASVLLTQLVRKELGSHHGIFYPDDKTCYEDRRQRRGLWKKIIADYNGTNKTRAIEQVLKDNDIYCGLRKWDEYLVAKKKRLFDIVIAVDASKRIGHQQSPDLEIPLGVADVYIDNNQSEVELEQRVSQVLSLLAEYSFTKYLENDPKLPIEPLLRPDRYEAIRVPQSLREEANRRLNERV